ncbi:Hypothetical predicted protein [Cloeon dipterum]|uniref:DUF4460 domain-containing protein n=1 Tax=Cloeon dipterum TaxID=197152 RepID=A0A8S1CDI4_9INSE|nr:Hypothetical predicted protein [Cloeon dipterum]
MATLITALCTNSTYKKYHLLQSSCCLWRKVCRPASTSSEVSTALRPFYFVVHPDLFGQHPKERAANEAALQQLSSYIETVLRSQTPVPTELRFFLKGKKGLKPTPLREVRVALKSRDLQQVVTSVLKSCSLPTEAAKKIPVVENVKKEDRFERDFTKYKANNSDYKFREEIRQERASFTLTSWLRNNRDEARQRQEAAAPTREEALRQSEALAKSLQLKEVKWDCGWSQAHFIGCLQSLHTLTNDHPDLLAVLKGRRLIFGNETGVSLDGLVMINSAEPRHNWLELVKQIPKADEALKRIPSLEQAVSGLLKDIMVVRRKFQQKVLVSEYEAMLRRLATSLNDYRGFRNYPAEWPESLKNFRLVVETAAGPLMLSPTGQFIVPSSCPAFLLVNFLSSNLEKAKNVLAKYQSDKMLEKILKKQVLVHLGLDDLRKDDAVTPERMVKCCERLLDAIPMARISSRLSP